MINRILSLFSKIIVGGIVIVFFGWLIVSLTTPVEYGFVNYEVTYFDGSLDTFKVRHEVEHVIYPKFDETQYSTRCKLNDGCLVLMGNTSIIQTVVCGIRSFRKIKN